MQRLKFLTPESLHLNINAAQKVFLLPDDWAAYQLQNLNLDVKPSYCIEK